MSTLILSRADVVRHLNSLFLLQDLREAFRSDALGRSVVPGRLRTAVHSGGAAVAQLPGCIPGVPAFSVKVETRFPDQHPAISSLLHLHDIGTGELLAILDSGHLSTVSMGVLGALAADVLARPDSSRVAILGAGAQGGVQLKCLRLVRTLTHVRVFDAEPANAAIFADRMYSELSLPMRMADSVAEAVSDADIVIAATTSSRPFLFERMVRPGSHVTTIGVDEPGRAELSPDLLERATFFCDHRGLAVSSGAIGAAGLTDKAIHAELGEVLAGTKRGRTSPDQITVFGAVGVAFADLAAAWQVYQSALEDEEIRRVDFPSRS